MDLQSALDSTAACRWTVSDNVQLEFLSNAIVKETMLFPYSLPKMLL